MLLDAYIRVSKVGQRKGENFISPSVQLEQIERWIRAHGHRLGNVFEELDQSGARSDRPLLMEALERIESGESQGIVVAKLDRFGRSVVDGLRAIKRIEVAGGTFASVNDGIDPTTATGKLILQVLLSIAEWELERTRSNWDIAKERAVARGAYPSMAPLGYKRGEDGRLRIDPQKAGIVRQIFERRARGESCYAIAKRLNEQGQTTRSGAPFSFDMVSRITKNRAYLGESHNGPHRNPTAHPPLVDEATWHLVQYTPRTPAEQTESILAGLIRCGGCGRMLSAIKPRADQSRRIVYRCDNDFGDCTNAGYARSDELDPLVEEFIFTRCGSPQTGRDGERERECEAEVEEARKELAAFRDEPILLETLGPNLFAEGLATRQEAIGRRLAQLAQVRAGAGPPRVDLEQLEANWGALTWVKRREAVAELLDCVVIEPGSAPVIDRAWVFRRGRGPLAMLRGRIVADFDLSSGKGERLQRPEPWPLPRLEGELLCFFVDRDIWPSYLEFARHGKGRLYDQTLRFGGPFFWAKRLAIRVPNGSVRWNEEMVNDALAPFLEGRRSWPTLAEFTKAGMRSVYHACQNNGGLAYWADAFNLPYMPGHKALWSDERIEASLRLFVGAGGVFPKKKEFKESGLGLLYEAICRHGGVAHWSERLGSDFSMSSVGVKSTPSRGPRTRRQVERAGDQGTRSSWLAPLIRVS